MAKPPSVGNSSPGHGSSVPGTTPAAHTPAAAHNPNLLHAAAPCFAAGTCIRTVRGEVPVEALREGDQVALADGGVAAVVWIGHRTVDLDRHRWPDLVRPIRVRADALRAGVPARDLLVSPEHALLVDGVLVPAGLLANGRSIVQERSGGTVTYYHVELPSHAVLLAEGAPAESYLDVGNRHAFENGAAQGEPLLLHPHFGPGSTEVAVQTGWCAPRVDDGPLLEAIRARLIARAEAFGRTVTVKDPDLHLVVDGRRLDHEAVGFGNRRCFRVPAHAREVRIVSHAACPAAEDATWAGDRRSLGVALSAIWLRAADIVLAIPMQDHSLEAGFHPVETAEGAVYRWTNGDAVLPERWMAAFRSAPMMLELTVCGTLPRYWVEPAHPCPTTAEAA